jgi:7-cyano-7-deazaguanine synthase
MSKNRKAVVMLSGGMDSAVCAAIAKSKGYEIAALHLNYGQKTQSKELECFYSLCKDFNAVEKLVVDVSHLAKIGGSSLTDENMPVEDSATLEKNEIPDTYVPFRNGNILAIAASWAEVIDAEVLVIGAMQLDYSGYPDCRDEFFEAMEKAINLGTKPDTHLKILTPIINFTKADVVRKGVELGVKFEHTWSCYSDSDKACGKCDSCVLRLKGFAEAGVEDSIEYL